MKIGIVSDSLAHLAFEEMLDSAVGLGVAGVELNTGNSSAAPHLNLTDLVANADARHRFVDAFASRGLELIALNANSNQLHPIDGARQSSTLHATVQLAGLLGVKKVCLMSGLPAGGPEDRTPNWIVSSWPPETGEIIAWQCQEKLIPYWRELATLGRPTTGSSSSASSSTATSQSATFPRCCACGVRSDRSWGRTSIPAT
jgi:sugar phosphate isomerase/epimerase